MDYLARDTAPFDAAFWQELDAAINSAAAQQMIARRVLPLHGPLGPGADVVAVDSPARGEDIQDSQIATTGRSYIPLPQLYVDFWLYWRDLARSGETDLAAASRAATELARKEDEMAFYGIKALGLKGLVNADKAQKQPLRDWNEGENAYLDVAGALTQLEEAGCFGRYSLVVSPDLYMALSRIQPGTGVMVNDRVAALIGSKVRKSTVLKEKTALLLCSEGRYLDLCVGMDAAAAYLELADLNHHFRIMETAALRVKDPRAIVVIA